VFVEPESSEKFRMDPELVRDHSFCTISPSAQLLLVHLHCQPFVACFGFVVAAQLGNDTRQELRLHIHVKLS